MTYIEQNVKQNIKTVSWFQSIRFKVVLIILLTTFLLLGISGYLAYGYIKETKSNELQQLAEVTATRLSQHLTVPMWDVNYEQVGQLLETEMNEQRIAGIMVLDEDQRSVFSARKRDTDNQPIELKTAISGNFLSASAEVINNQMTFGFVTVYLSQSFLTAELTQFAKGIALVMILLAAGITLVTTIVLNRIVIQPLKRLTENAQEISRGDFRQEIDTRRTDEIGYLGSTLDRMQYSLLVAIKRIRSGSEATEIAS